ncbi:hypothetical protein [Hyalangium sp.]|uniref:hypothetical protein n=1 Tax=Hyalangium sp. TaxID=2028555 RepID=UPI002D60A9EC|nr:hypothetical protein [Hyalangium sp.]HYH96676.1 hypothetical protein [Hyalangium sp.]
MTRLRATPGVELTEARLGKPCSATALAKANELLDGGLGKTLTALYGEVDGISSRWTGGGEAGEVGVLPLAQMVGKGSPTAAAADLARAMNDALPGWEHPAFLPKAPKTSAATSAKPARVSKGAGKPISRDPYPAIDEPPFIFLEQVYKSEDAAPERVAFSPNGRSVVAIGHGHFHVIDLGTREIRWRVPLGAQLLAATHSNGLRVWRL